MTYGGAGIIEDFPMLRRHKRQWIEREDQKMPPIIGITITTAVLP